MWRVQCPHCKLCVPVKPPDSKGYMGTCINCNIIEFWDKLPPGHSELETIDISWRYGNKTKAAE